MWKQVLKAAGAAAVTVHPAGAAVLAAVNAFLPEGQKLPSSATGDQVAASIDALPADQRLALYDRLAEVEIVESNNFSANVIALAKADEAGNSTRPAIALMMAKVVCFAVIVLVGAIAVCLVVDNADSLKALAEAWELVLVALGTPLALLRAYFGMRTREKQARYAAANGAVDLGLAKGWLNRLGV